eukprot:489166_1
MFTNSDTRERQPLLHSTSSTIKQPYVSINITCLKNIFQHLFTIIFYMLNIITDIMVLHLYYIQNKIIAFYLVIAAIVITQISYCIFFIYYTTQHKKWHLRLFYILFLIPISFLLPFITYMYGLNLIPNFFDKLLTQPLDLNIPTWWKDNTPTKNHKQEQLSIFYLTDAECFGFTMVTSIESGCMIIIQIFVICYHNQHNLHTINHIQLISLIISLLSLSYQIRGCYTNERNNKLHTFMCLCITLDVWRCALMILLVYNYSNIFFIWSINISFAVILHTIFAIGIAVESHAKFVNKVKETHIILYEWHKVIKAILWIICYLIGFIIWILFVVVTFIVFQYSHFLWLDFVVWNIHTNFFDNVQETKLVYWDKIYAFIQQADDYYSSYNWLCKDTHKSSNVVKRSCIVNYFVSAQINNEQKEFRNYLRRNEFDNYSNVSFKDIRKNNVLFNKLNKKHIVFRIFIGLIIVCKIFGV